jgi:uncharacterized repeat protein (TIGR01451 family)
MNARIRRLLPALVAAAALLSLVLGLSSARAVGPPGVDPASTTLTLLPGESSAVIHKTVHTPTIPPKPDLVFLSDTTGSMGGAIANVKANAVNVMNTVLAAQPQAQFGAAQYKDFFECSGDPFAFNLDQAITPVTADVQTGINSWSAFGGCDTPEQAIFALDQLANGPTGFRPDSSRIIAWFGDAPSHEDGGVTLAQAIADLQAANIRVIAIDVGALDAFGQASAITAATGGVLLPSGGDVSAAILEGLSNLPAVVTHTESCGDPDVTVALAPPSQTVTSGGDVSFDETVSVSPTSTGNKTVHCDVDFLINGVPAGPEFHEDVNVTIPGADVSVLKTGPALVTQGQTYSYQLVASNAGPATAVAATVTDALPANVAFVSATSPDCSFAAPVVTCDAGNLAAGASTTFTITVTALSTGNGITNTAAIVSTTGDPDTGNNSSTTSTTLNHNPVCTAASAGPDLWPPNHKMSGTLSISGVTDPDGNPVSVTITGIFQDEPTNGLGDGDTGPADATILGANSFTVRAERSGTLDGRVYYVQFTGSDALGGTCTGTATISVPHDQAHAAVGQGPLVSST